MSYRTITGALASRPAQGVRAPSPAAQLVPGEFDRDYWIRRSEGYRVDGVEGRLGTVDSIQDGADGEPVLAVRAGLLGRRLMLVHGREVAFIVPRAGRIWLFAPTEILGSEAA
jgi:hypothetical protein